MIISNNVRLCTSIWSKGTGLMFRFPKDFAFVFEFSKPQQFLITMWWVFFPIDIVFLDEHKKIVEVKLRLLPFTHFRSKSKACYFIELPNGYIQKYQLSKGLKLSWNSKTLQTMG